MNVKWKSISIFISEHAIRSIYRIQLFFFASVELPTKNATRESMTIHHELFFNYSFVFSSFDGVSFEYASNSTYTHRFTYGLANYKGWAMTTGCQDSPTCYVKTEFMDLNTLKWSDGPDYPFTSS